MSRQRQAKSAAWRRRQDADIYTRKAKEAGYRSRAAYKLLEISRGSGLLRRGMTVTDLGAAPGGWSQVARQTVGDSGRVAAVDVLEMAPVAGVHFIHGDFTAPAVQARVLQISAAADAVISDMAPNLSGVAVRDQANARALFDAALAFCGGGGLKDGGDFLIKTFAGEMHSDCRAALRPLFRAVRVITPDATRKNSRECYLLGQGFCPAAGV